MEATSGQGGDQRAAGSSAQGMRHLFVARATTSPASVERSTLGTSLRLCLGEMPSSRRARGSPRAVPTPLRPGAREVQSCCRSLAPSTGARRGWG